MNKNFLVKVLVLFFVSQVSLAQRWERALFFGGPDEETTIGISKTSNGKIVMAGGFRDSIIMKSNTYYGQLPVPYNSDFFLALLDSTGNEVWVKTFSTNASNSGATGDVVVDRQNNIYMMLTSLNTTLALQGGTSYSVTQNSLLKFDPSGNLLWLKSYSVDALKGISLTKNNTVRLWMVKLGNYNSLTINDYTLNYSGLIDPQLILELDQNGNTISSKVLNNKNNILKVADDSLGNYYVRGVALNATGTIDFIDGTPDVETGATNSSYWIKFKENGAAVWTKYIADATSGILRMAAVNKAGNLLGNIATLTTSQTFTYEGTAFNPSGKNLVTHALLDSAGHLKSVSSGEVTRTVFDAINASFNAQGYFYALGRYAPAATFGDVVLPDGGNNTTDAYLVKYNADGEQVWFKNVTGIGNQFFNFITVDGNYVYVSASINAGAAQVEGQYVYTDGDWNLRDIFFARLRDCNATLIKSGLTLQANAGTSYKWYRDGALVNGANAQMFTPTYNGRYQVEVTFPGNCTCKTASFNYTDGVTGVRGEAVEEGIRVFPNPAFQSSSYLQAPEEAGQLELSLIDGKGQTVYTRKLERGGGELNWQGIQKGLYVLKVFSERGFWQNKMIIE